MFIVQNSRYSWKLSGFPIKYPQILELTHSQSHLPAAQFSGAEAIHTVRLFVQPGTHDCWVSRGGMNSKLDEGFSK